MSRLYVATHNGRDVACDYGPATEVATRVSRDASDELICEAHAREHYEDWRASTAPIGPRTLAIFAPGIAPILELKQV